MASQIELTRFGTALRRKRQQKKLTQRALAKSIGISNSQLNNVESGRNWPSLPAYFKLCRALDGGIPPFTAVKPASITV